MPLCRYSISFVAMSRPIPIHIPLTLIISAVAIVFCTEDRLMENPITLLPEQDRLLLNGNAAEQVSGYFKVQLLFTQELSSAWIRCAGYVL